MSTTNPAETALLPCDACGRNAAPTDEVLCPSCKARLFPKTRPAMSRRPSDAREAAIFDVLDAMHVGAVATVVGHSVKRLSADMFEVAYAGEPRFAEKADEAAANLVSRAIAIPTISRGEYDRARRQGYAGPVAELLPETRALPAFAGATHWRLELGKSGTTLCGVVVS